MRMFRTLMAALGLAGVMTVIGSASADWKPAEAVEVFWKGSWYKAAILEKSGGNTYRIHYDGYAASWDETVGTARIRPVGGWGVGSRVEVEWKASWYAATVVQVDGDRFKVHYDGYAASWDEFVGYHRMRGLGGGGGGGAVAVAAVPLTCSDSPKSLAKTSTFRGVCPGSCASGSLWGTDVYTTDSSICTAARHAGLLGPGGGEVSVSFEAGRSAYTGSTRNGVTSGSWGSYGMSYRVSR